MGHFLIDNRINKLKARESYLLSQKKHLRKDLPQIRKTIQRLKTWNEELMIYEAERKSDEILKVDSVTIDFVEAEKIKEDNQLKTMVETYLFLKERLENETPLEPIKEPKYFTSIKEVQDYKYLLDERIEIKNYLEEKKKDFKKILDELENKFLSIIPINNKWLILQDGKYGIIIKEEERQIEFSCVSELVRKVEIKENPIIN